MSNHFEQILDDCLGRLAAGETVDGCLQRYPEHAADLRPLLQTASAMRHSPKPAIDTDARAAGLQQMLNRVPAATDQTERSGFLATLRHFGYQLERYFMKPLTTVAAVVALIFIGVLWVNSLQEQTVQPAAEPQIDVTTVADNALENETAPSSNTIGGLRFAHPETGEPFYWLLPNFGNQFYISQDSGPMQFDLLINVAELPSELTSFVHLYDANGTLVTQTDRPFEPATAETVWLTANRQVVAADTAGATPFLAHPQQIVMPSMQGRYRLEAGLYDPATGRRITYMNGDDTVHLLEVDVVYEERVRVAWEGAVETDTAWQTDPQAHLELGVEVFNLDVAQLERGKTFGWVQHRVYWTPETTTATVAEYVDEAHAAGFNVLVTIESYEHFPERIDFAALQAFVAEVAALGPEAIELWPNANDQGWPLDAVSPADYVNNLLAPAYQVIKTADPTIQVISGAPEQRSRFTDCSVGSRCSDEAFLEALFAAGAADYLDCVGASYIVGATAPSEMSGHPADDGHHSWYYPTLVDTYSAITDAPICFTRLGYAVGEFWEEPPEAYGWSADTSWDERAEWLPEAIAAAQRDPQVQMMMLYSYDTIGYGAITDLYALQLGQPGWCYLCALLKEAFVTTTLADEPLAPPPFGLPDQLTLLDGTVCTQVVGQTLSFDGRRANYHCGDEADGQKRVLVGEVRESEMKPVRLLIPDVELDETFAFSWLPTLGRQQGGLLEAIMIDKPDHPLSRCVRLSAELPDIVFDGRPALYECEDYSFTQANAFIVQEPAAQTVYEVTMGIVVPNGGNFELPAATLEHRYAIAP